MAGCCLAGAPHASAGIFEVGASGTYRRSNIGANAFDESQSLTASLSYYLNDSSAVELSYTHGLSERSIAEGEPNGHVTNLTYQTLGLDFVYTLGDREAAFRPYLKAGGNYILKKRLVDQYSDANGNWFSAQPIEEDPTLVPSAGFGFRLALTKALVLKIGVDAWTNPLNEDEITIDYAGRAGLSVMF